MAASEKDREKSEKSVSYLGPEGSYSSLAARQFFTGEGISGLPCKSFYEALQMLCEGKVDYAVLPVENTLQGAVTQSLDLMYESEGICAVQEYVLRIDHRLIAKEGTRLCDVRRVFSHEQAIMQCGKFLARELPQAEIIYTESTAQSLQRIEKAGDAGIVGAHICEPGFSFIGGSIADEPKNFTHFLLATKGKIPVSSEKIYFAATCPHEPGALLKVLQILAIYDLNMTKIESRPIKNSPGEYCFFIEFKGNIADKNVSSALERLGEYTKNYKLLGCY